MTARTQQARTETNNTPPANLSLLPGQLYLELGTPLRVWSGVPAALDPTGRKLLFDASASNALMKTGDTATGLIVFSAGISVTALPASFGVPVSARSVLLGNPTGGSAGDMGVGTINVSTGFYVNGVSIGTGPFLPLSGGTVSNLTVSTTLSVGGAVSAGSLTTPGAISAGSVTTTGDIQGGGKIIASEGGVNGHGFSFIGDGAFDTGMFSSGDGILNFYDNGNLAFTVDAGGNVTFTGTPKVGSATLATQSWVGSQGYATTSWVQGQGYATTGQLGNYLPLSGGTLSNPGNLTINGQTNTGGQIWCGSDIIIPNNKSYFGKDTGGGPVQILQTRFDNWVQLGDGGHNISLNAIGGNGFAVYTTGNFVCAGIVYVGSTGAGNGGAWYMSSGYMRTDQCGKSAGWLPTSDNGSSNGLTGQAWSQVASYWFNTVSARALKTDIKQVTDAHALAQVMKLRPSTYHWKDEGWHEPGKRIERKRHVGFIADEVAQALGHDFGGYNIHEGVEGLNYAELVATLWAAVRALAAKVEGKHGAV